MKRKPLACAICGHRFSWIVVSLILTAAQLTSPGLRKKAGIPDKFVKWPHRVHASICCPECGHEARAQFTSRDVLEVA